jgi:hypothetical protein
MFLNKGFSILSLYIFNQNLVFQTSFGHLSNKNVIKKAYDITKGGYSELINHWIILYPKSSTLSTI